MSNSVYQVFLPNKKNCIQLYGCKLKIKILDKLLISSIRTNSGTLTNTTSHLSGSLSYSNERVLHIP